MMKRKIMYALIGVALVVSAVVLWIATPIDSTISKSGTDVTIEYEDGTSETFTIHPLRTFSTITYAGKAVDGLKFKSWLQFVSSPSVWNPTVKYLWTLKITIHTASPVTMTGEGSVTLSEGEAKVYIKTVTYTADTLIKKLQELGVTAKTGFTIKVELSHSFVTTDPYGRPITGEPPASTTEVSLTYDPTTYEVTSTSGTTTSIPEAHYYYYPEGYPYYYYGYGYTLIPASLAHASMTMSIFSQSIFGVPSEILYVLLAIVGVALLTYAWLQKIRS